MSNVLRKARILSSENDASVKQSQETNVEIKIKPSNSQPVGQPISQPVYYPNVPHMNSQIPSQSRDVNFTIPEENSQYQFQPPTSKAPAGAGLPATIVRDKGIIDLGNHIVAEGEARNEIEDLTVKNKFLETLLSIYELNPLRVNNYLVCHSNSLMELIKILTHADKVELIIDEDSGCTGCVSKNKYLEIQRILVTKDGKSNDLKYGYNDVYAQLVRYGISLKLCV